MVNASTVALVVQRVSAAAGAAAAAVFQLVVYSDKVLLCCVCLCTVAQVGLPVGHQYCYSEA
jgi:hypothetical protein